LSALCVLIGVLLIVLTWGFWDPWASLCKESLNDLPVAIPDRLIVEVVDEYMGRLVAGIRPAVESGLRDGLGVYPFFGRVMFRFEDNQTPPPPSDHVMRLRVFLRGTVTGPGLFPRAGLMCRNFVAVEFTNDRAVLSLRLTHKFGHYFGLSHEERRCTTYMRRCELRPDPAADRFNTEQLDILQSWDHPGGHYIPHWQSP